MTEVLFKDYIIKSELENTDENQKIGNKEFETKDFVFLPIGKDHNNRMLACSDYAVLCGCQQSAIDVTENGERCGNYWTREANSWTTAKYIESNGEKSALFCGFSNLGYPFLMNVDLKVLKSKDIKVETKGKLHTIKAGSFPCSYVGDKLNEELKKAHASGKMKETGKQYPGYMGSSKTLQYNDEFEYNGEKYVRTANCSVEGSDCEFKDKTKVTKKERYYWVKVEPVSWVIDNWEYLPKYINPNGLGISNIVHMSTEYLMLGGIPYSLGCGNKYGKDTMYQNTIIRAIMNGYKYPEEIIDKDNGHQIYITDDEFDFSGKGVVNQMFNGWTIEIEDINDKNEKKYKEFKGNIYAETPAESENPYGLVFKELSDDELLKTYVDAGMSVFLHGPSGVGKTSRVLAIDPDLTRITLRKDMMPEEVDGVLNRESKNGEYFPPYWYTELVRKCKAEPDKKHILYIDELTNVPPSAQSLVYEIVHDRAGKGGMWKLPDNASVVATGNELNCSATYPLTEPLFRRFFHLYFDVNKKSWLDWATEISETSKEGRAKIHPSIISYLISRDAEILYQEYDEDNPKIVTDTRKWEKVSDMLYETNNPYSLKGGIGAGLMIDFVNFLRSIQITPQKVIAGNYDKNRFNKSISLNSKLSAVLGLVPATEKELPVVRDFIRENLGNEMLATFDTMWIRNDPERAQIISELDDECLEEEQGDE